ncbi:MAG: hypothetical protein LWW97_09700 [Deltaproteobacteria bacterium]|nr:hypothetical protein [Deltaproteobacteria bacterium]
MLEWLLQNKEWLFSGIGIFIVALAINIFSSQIPPATSKLGSLIARIPFSDWFKKNEEWIFSGFRVFIVGIIISITANITADKVKQDTLESYSTQLESLENVEQSLVKLNEFVASQKQKLTESQNVINKLKDEHEKLKPIVEADRKVIDTVFALQEGRVKNKMWQDRAVSFFLGILASMIASLVFTLIRTTMLKKRNDED